MEKKPHFHKTTCQSLLEVETRLLAILKLLTQHLHLANHNFTLNCKFPLHRTRLIEREFKSSTEVTDKVQRVVLIEPTLQQIDPSEDEPEDIATLWKKTSSQGQEFIRGSKSLLSENLLADFSYGKGGRKRIVKREDNLVENEKDLLEINGGGIFVGELDFGELCKVEEEEFMEGEVSKIKVEDELVQSFGGDGICGKRKKTQVAVEENSREKDIEKFPEGDLEFQKLFPLREDEIMEITDVEVDGTIGKISEMKEESPKFINEDISGMWQEVNDNKEKDAPKIDNKNDNLQKINEQGLHKAPDISEWLRKHNQDVLSKLQNRFKKPKQRHKIKKKFKEHSNYKINEVEYEKEENNENEVVLSDNKLIADIPIKAEGLNQSFVTLSTDGVRSIECLVLGYSLRLAKTQKNTAVLISHHVEGNISSRSRGRSCKMSALALHEEQAFVTLALRDSYGLGCVVLGHSIRKVNTSRKVVVLVAAQVSQIVRDLLAKVFDEVINVPILDGSDPRIRRPDLSASLTKIECWNLTKYDKCVFLECDTLLLRNCDELFELDELSASPDIGWPDHFNTGVFVFKPSTTTYESLITFAKEKGSFDGGEHGLLNLYFGPDWKKNINKRLSFVYNVISGYIYTYAPAFKRFGDLCKIAHFVGHPKPWLANWHREENVLSAEFADPSTQHPFLQTWLNIFWENVFPNLPTVCNDLTESGDSFSIWSLITAMQTPGLHLMARKKKQIVSEECVEKSPLKVVMPSHDPKPCVPCAPCESKICTPPSSPSPSTSRHSPMERRSFEAKFSTKPDLVQSYRPSRASITSPEPKYSEQIQIQARSHSSSPIRSAGLRHGTSTESSVSSGLDVTKDEGKVEKKIRRIAEDPFIPVEMEIELKQRQLQERQQQQQLQERQQQHAIGLEGLPSTSGIEESNIASEIATTQQVEIKEPERKEEKFEVIKSLREEKIEESPKRETREQIESRRMKEWEAGKVDYMGVDRFENIQKKLDSLITNQPATGEAIDEEEAELWQSGFSELSELIPREISPPDANVEVEPIEEVKSPEKNGEKVEPLKQVKLPKKRDPNELPGYAVGDYSGMHDWEAGKIDVTGRDKSDNIIKRLDFLINQSPSAINEKK